MLNVNPFPDRLAAAALGVAALAACLGAVPARAADPSPALVESARARVTVADLDAELVKLTPADRAQFSASPHRLVQYLETLFSNRAVANDARAEGLDRDPVLSRQIQVQVDKLLAQARLAKLERDVAAAFDADPEVHAARAREIYLTQPERFHTVERVRVSRLLVKAPTPDDDAARARAEALRERLVGGAAFADVARDASDDPAAKAGGGDLGWVTARQLEPSVAAAAFALRAPGDLTPVVKSKAGYQVIQLQERAPAVLRSFDDVRPDILVEIRKAVVDDARKAYLTQVFADPVAKFNDDLIARIAAEAQKAAPPTGGTPKPQR